MLRFVDLLIFLLQTQGETLKRLAAFFGEDELITLLESVDEIPNGNLPSASVFLPKAEWFDDSKVQAGRSGSSYYELEDAVRELKLISPLEFHLWAYPFYRVLIESGVELDSIVQTSSKNSSYAPGSDPLDILIAETLKQAKDWVHGLPIPPAVYLAAESAAMTPWLRYRAKVLQKAGKKLLSPLPPS